MPDVNKQATLTQIRNWLYNSGSYGRKPSVLDMIDKGWLPLVQAGVIYTNYTNDDMRYRFNDSGYAIDLQAINNLVSADSTRQVSGLERISYLYGLSKDPGVTTYNLIRFAPLLCTVAGGGGAVAVQTLIPANATNKLLVHKIVVDLATNTADGLSGARILVDDEDGTVLGYIDVSAQQPHVEATMIFAPTNAVNKAVRITVGAAQHTVLDNGDTLYIQGSFAPIGA